MNNRKKKILTRNRIISIVIVLLCVLVVIAFLIIINKKDKSNNLVDSDTAIYNKNNSFLKDHNVTGIVFKDIKCTYDGKNSLITYTIVNTTNKKINLYNYEILVKDKNKKTLTNIEFNYNNSLFPNEEVKISNSVIEVDLTNAYYMNLKINTKNQKKKK